jgi:hypothetical protein
VFFSAYREFEHMREFFIHTHNQHTASQPFQNQTLERSGTGKHM